jgi:hypothetical protein
VRLPEPVGIIPTQAIHIITVIKEKPLVVQSLGQLGRTMFGILMVLYQIVGSMENGYLIHGKIVSKNIF